MIFHTLSYADLLVAMDNATEAQENNLVYAALRLVADAGFMPDALATRAGLHLSVGAVYSAAIAMVPPGHGWCVAYADGDSHGIVGKIIETSSIRDAIMVDHAKKNLPSVSLAKAVLLFYGEERLRRHDPKPFVRDDLPEGSTP